MEIEESKFYQPDDDVMRAIAAKQVLARWRNEQRNLPFHQFGSKVLYRGSDVLKFIDAQRVELLVA